MFGSLITQPLRIATRGVEVTLRSAEEVVEVAEGLIGLVLARLIGGNGHRSGEEQTPEPAAWRGPAASSTSSPADAPAVVVDPDPPVPAPGPAEPPTPAPAPPIPAPEPPIPAPGPPEVPGPPEAPIPAPADPAASLFADTSHVDEETELVDEIADPGAEDGAGAELRIGEPWDGYRTMKAADIIDRLATASPEQLAAVELYELAGRNRKSVVVAAQRALRRSSPPRP